MVGVEAYLSIRKHTFDIGLSFFENDDENGKGLGDNDVFDVIGFIEWYEFMFCA